MAFPRITAVVFVFLLMTCLALVGIGGVAFVGPSLTHGDATAHDAGTIIAISRNMDFVLKMANGQDVHFQCSEQCVKALRHMQRHLLIHAHTDVYYIQGMADNTLIAVNVD